MAPEGLVRQKTGCCESHPGPKLTTGPQSESVCPHSAFSSVNPEIYIECENGLVPKEKVHATDEQISHLMAVKDSQYVVNIHCGIVSRSLLRRKVEFT